MFHFYLKLWPSIPGKKSNTSPQKTHTQGCIAAFFLAACKWGQLKHPSVYSFYRILFYNLKKEYVTIQMNEPRGTWTVKKIKCKINILNDFIFKDPGQANLSDRKADMWCIRTEEMWGELRWQWLRGVWIYLGPNDTVLQLTANLHFFNIFYAPDINKVIGCLTHHFRSLLH